MCWLMQSSSLNAAGNLFAKGFKNPLSHSGRCTWALQEAVAAAAGCCQRSCATTLAEVAAYLEWRLPGVLSSARVRAVVLELLQNGALQVAPLRYART